jgi:amino acid transporter
MAPTLAMSVTGVAAAAALGRAAPLAFAVAALGVGLVAYGFVRLAGEFSHAGSVYAFVGKTLGPRAGFLAGWALLGTYLVFPPVSLMGVAVFGRAFLAATGLAGDADWYPLALAGLAVIWVLAARGVRPTTRSVLVFEVVSVCLILVLMAVIWWRLAAGDAPAGQHPSAQVFVLPPGVGLAVLALAATSGFLAFAGFESAGSLGEESLLPTRTIPRAIITAVAFGAVF